MVKDKVSGIPFIYGICQPAAEFVVIRNLDPCDGVLVSLFPTADCEPVSLLDFAIEGPACDDIVHRMEPAFFDSPVLIYQENRLAVPIMLLLPASGLACLGQRFLEFGVSDSVQGIQYGVLMFLARFFYQCPDCRQDDTDP